MPLPKPLFSALDKAVESLTRTRGTGQAFVNELLKNPMVKPTELYDRGLDQALKSLPTTDKATVQKIVKSKPVPQIKQKTLGAPDYRDLDKQEHALVSDLEDHLDRVGMDHMDPEAYAELMELQNIRDKSTFDTLSDEQSKLYKEINKARDAGNMSRVRMLKQDVDHLDNRINYLDNMKIVTPYHEGLTIPNGENYREMLLTLPNGGFGGVSSHFGGEPNIIASMRLKDRTGPNGEKVLHLEELQSDWHQRGKDTGYQLPPEETAPMDSEYRALVHKNADARLSGLEPDPKDVERAKQLEAELIRSDTSKIPNAPFKKNWEELALKHLVNHAVENGYDKIAITPGATQADRYKLSKHIDSLNVFPMDDGNYNLSFITTNGLNPARQYKTVSPNELSNTVGKDLAKQIVSDMHVDNNPNQVSKEYTGLDLDVGGKGMIEAYDKRIPSILNKLGKPFGAQTNLNAMPVETGKQIMVPDNAGLGMISSGQPETANLHTFDVTPQLSEKAQTEGFPLYKRGGKVQISTNPDTHWAETKFKRK